MSKRNDEARRRLVLTDDGAAFDPGLCLALLADVRARTLERLDGIGTDEIDRAMPDVCSSTIGSLLYHIAAIEYDWLYADLLGEPFPDDARAWFPLDVRGEDGRLAHVTGVPPARHRARIEHVRAMLTEALRAIPPDNWDTPRARERYDVSPAWILGHLMQHEAEHRGQIRLLRSRFRTLNEQ